MRLLLNSLINIIMKLLSFIANEAEIIILFTILDDTLTTIHFLRPLPVPHRPPRGRRPQNCKSINRCLLFDLIPQLRTHSVRSKTN